MIEATEFIEAARRAGFTWYAGVPCSFLTPFINHVIDDPTLQYVSAANEGDAVAAAAGASIGGRLAVAMMQNSGLGNAVSPLTSLTHVFHIPLLLICTHRGAPGVADEPQHALMGTITGELLDTLQIPWEHFPTEPQAIEAVLTRAIAHLTSAQRPYGLLMQQGSVAPQALGSRGVAPARASVLAQGALGGHADRPSRTAALERIIAATPLQHSVVIATTGYTGRELYALADRDNHLYLVGSMGCATSLGLGLAMARPDLHVVVVDGDGAALMRMGNFATLGHYGPANLSHVLLDNEMHESTGGQSTVSPWVDFAQIAAACGYTVCQRAATLDDVDRFLTRHRQQGAGFLHLKTSPGIPANLPRPSTPPPTVLRRLTRHLTVAPDGVGAGSPPVR